MELGLKGKTVIITGGGSNIGRAILLAFAAEGCNVVSAEIDEVQGQRVVDQANALKKGGTTVLIKTDVTDGASVQAMVARTMQRFGSIHALVNNVGGTMDRLFIEKTREEWEKEIRVNYWSFLNCTRGVLDHMIAEKRGSIVSIGSDAGRMGEFREAVYGGMKGAIIASSKAIAREVGRYGIRVNVVCPGVTIPKPEEMGNLSIWKDMLTVFTPEAQERASRLYALRRLGKAEEVANAVVFMSSDAASFITGQTLSVSGGYTMM
ncbi:MAG: SDR family NAD(P)-dependent oxidoreductase [Chloroflexota bacterium]|nr:SDR family NAD(P)-dependent oxidoreductase [Chloroflexota bacterium]